MVERLRLSGSRQEAHEARVAAEYQARQEAAEARVAAESGRHEVAEAEDDRDESDDDREESDDDGDESDNDLFAARVAAKGFAYDEGRRAAVRVAYEWANLKRAEAEGAAEVARAKRKRDDQDSAETAAEWNRQQQPARILVCLACRLVIPVWRDNCDACAGAVSEYFTRDASSSSSNRRFKIEIAVETTPAGAVCEVVTGEPRLSPR
jgi:hypothetical protein